VEASEVAATATAIGSGGGGGDGAVPSIGRDISIVNVLLRNA
jgi:hypothetical protein